MPVTPMFHVHAWGFPYIATMLGVKQVYCPFFCQVEAVETAIWLTEVAGLSKNGQRVLDHR
jgi:hypothetical protein